MSPVIIAGFHRSGTSAVARSLALAGLHLGDDLLGSEPSNPYGHYEDNEVIDIHQTLLDVNGVDWKLREPIDPLVPERTWRAVADLVGRRQSVPRPWGFKDPRVCLFMPIWLHAIPDVRVVVVFRRPVEAIRSLLMRHSRQLVVAKGRGEVHREFWEEPDLAARMWLTYHRMLLDSLPPPPQVHVVDFGDRAAISRIAGIVNERWSLGLETDHAPALDPNLGGSEVAGIAVRDAGLADDIEAMWVDLRARARTSAALLEVPS